MEELNIYGKASLDVAGAEDDFYGINQILREAASRYTDAQRIFALYPGMPDYMRDEGRQWREETIDWIFDLAVMHADAKKEMGRLYEIVDGEREFDPRMIEIGVREVGEIYTNALWYEQKFTDFDSYIANLDEMED